MSLDLPGGAERPRHQASQPQRFCPYCGGGIAGDARFCTWCSKEIPAVAPVPLPVAQAERASGSRKPNRLVIVLAVLVVIAASGVVFYGATRSTGGAGSANQVSADLTTLVDGLNDNPPSYIKQVSAYKEGFKAFMIYFILADASGAMTTADGTATVVISESNYGSGEIERYRRSFNVKKTDFRKTTVGRGAFEREVILLPIGRIQYSQFKSQPRQSTGNVKITFSPGNLVGEETVFFDR